MLSDELRAKNAEILNKRVSDYAAAMQLLHDSQFLPPPRVNTIDLLLFGFRWGWSCPLCGGKINRRCVEYPAYSGSMVDVIVYECSSGCGYVSASHPPYESI